MVIASPDAAAYDHVDSWVRSDAVAVSAVKQLFPLILFLYGLFHPEPRC